MFYQASRRAEEIKAYNGAAGVLKGIRACFRFYEIEKDVIGTVEALDLGIPKFAKMHFGSVTQS